MFTEVAEEVAANLIILINMFEFNTVATAFIWQVALEETKGICNSISSNFMAIVIGHFEIFSVR